MYIHIHTHTHIYISLQRECTPRQTFLSPGQRNVEKPWPVFSAFLFFTNPILYSFSRYPLFFSLPRSLRPLFLRAFCRWWMEKVKTWPVSERVESVFGVVCVCVYVCVESRALARMIGEFSGKAYQVLPNCEFRACLSPLSFLFVREYTLHPSFPPFLIHLSYSLIGIKQKFFKIVCRFWKFSIGSNYILVVVSASKGWREG